jgi:hypothetical protein
VWPPSEISGNEGHSIQSNTNLFVFLLLQRAELGLQKGDEAALIIRRGEK